LFTQTVHAALRTDPTRRSRGSFAVVNGKHRVRLAM